MCVRSVGYGLLAGLWMVALAGCQKSSSGEASPGQETASIQAKAPLSETVARLHWLGKKRLEGETNAAFFMSVWNLPESTKLEAQTLDKLAVAFAGFISGATNPASATNSSVVGLVRPLLDDLLKEECYFEVRSATNQPGEIALAIRLNEDRADVWKNNFPKLFEHFAASKIAMSGGDSHRWQLELENETSRIKNHITLARAGTWTLVTLTRWLVSAPTAPQSFVLLDEMCARIEREDAPFLGSTNNFWVQADINLAPLTGAFSYNGNLSPEAPRISLTMIGDGINVRTRAELALVKPLALELEPWNIPTNLVHNPLVGFSAVNGIRPLLLSLQAWTSLGLATPNQFYLWGLEGAAVETYFAAPLADASNGVYALGGKLMEVNSWLNTNRMGELERAGDGSGVSWKGFPFVAPFLKAIGGSSNGFAFGGLGPESAVTNPPPEALIREIMSHTNLVCYDWEITGPRILSGIYISQVIRVMLQKAQLPKESFSMQWLKALSSKLGNCGTEITVPDPMHLSISRKSSIGLTATELHLIADWLESPNFPFGLHTLVAPPPSMPGERVANAKTTP